MDTHENAAVVFMRSRNDGAVPSRNGPVVDGVMCERAAYQVDRAVVQKTSRSAFWKTSRAWSLQIPRP